MGFLSKVVLVLVGLFALGMGLWPVTLVCFLYVSRPLWRAHGRKKADIAPKGSADLGARPSARLLLLVALGVLSSLSSATGGRMSALFFVSLTAVVILWPRIASAVRLGSVVPIEGTILLRSRFFPFRWFSIAEVKAGNEHFARNISHIRGQLMVDNGGRAVYYVAQATALGKASARTKVLTELRRAARIVSPNGAYILPIDSEAASDKFRLGFVREPFDVSHFVDEHSPIPDVFLIRSQGGYVEGISAYSIDDSGARGSVIPVASTIQERPLLWEILDRLGKDRPWPQQDSKTDFLESLFLTKGGQLSDRMSSLRGSGEKIAVESIAGSSLEFSRPELRAILSIYQ